jgi:hypothetical protein
MTRPVVYLNLQYSEVHYNGILLYTDKIVMYMECECRRVLD